MSLTEERKQSYKGSYKQVRNAIFTALQNIWGVSDSFEQSYCDDYQMLQDEKVCFMDKYTVTVFSSDPVSTTQNSQYQTTFTGYTQMESCITLTTRRGTGWKGDHGTHHALFFYLLAYWMSFTKYSQVHHSTLINSLLYWYGYQNVMSRSTINSNKKRNKNNWNQMFLLNSGVNTLCTEVK